MSRVHYFAVLEIILDFLLLRVSGEYKTRVNVEFTRAYLLPNFGFFRQPTPTRYQCAELCYNYKLCKSLQFDIENKLCQLNVMIKEDAGYFHSDKNILYAAKTTISKSIAGACADHNCDDFSMCSDINGKPSCIQQFQKEQECKFPIMPDLFTPVTNETSVPIGTIALHHCNFPLYGFQLATCKPYNHWVMHYKNCHPDFCYNKFHENDYFMQRGYSIALVDGTYGSQNVLCNSQNHDWMEIQHRVTSTSFSRSTNYTKTINKPYWIGNYMLSLITNHMEVELRVELTFRGDSTVYFARYGHFSIATGNMDNYSLSIFDYLGGNCGDGLSYLNGLEFQVMDDGRRGWWQRRNSSCTNLNADATSGFLRWSTDCLGNNTEHWTNIETTQIMIKRIKKPWE